MKGKLQKALDDAVSGMPRVFLEEAIEKKLIETGIEPTRKFVTELAEKAMLGDDHKIEWNDSSIGRDVVISFTEDDVIELKEAVDEFVEELPTIVEDLLHRSARSFVRTLKKNWPAQAEWEQQTFSEFRDRLEDRWGEALHLLRMLLTISRELGEEAHRKGQLSRAKRNLHRREVLLRLHARACQVTGEIVTLMESGYADGAMARWRTLHEICTVATLIAEHDDQLAERYLDHHVVESKRALTAYQNAYKDLGYRAPTKREVRRTEKHYEAVISRYGSEFGSPHGWAANHLGKKKPSFSDLEEAAQRSRLRAHYQMACNNVHAGVKGITDQLGLLPGELVILAGASNAGLEEPGQNTAITLTQITFTLVGPRCQLDDTVILRAVADLQDRAVNAFVRAGRRLKREEAARRRQG